MVTFTKSPGLEAYISIPDGNDPLAKMMTTPTKPSGLDAYISKMTQLEKHLGWSAPTDPKDATHKLTQVSPNQFIQRSKWPLVSTRLQSNYKTPPWEMALENIPKLSGDFFS